MLRLVCAIVVPRATVQRSGIVCRRLLSTSASDEGEAAFDAAVFERSCSSPASTAVDGLSTTAFAPEVCAKLMDPINANDVEIRPDGTLYLPEIKYRRILNGAIGPGGWALIPRGPPSHIKDIVFREFALFCYGKYTAQAIGEQQLAERGMTSVTAIEAAKSNALMRCCKDIGIASELWDPDFIKRWKNQNAVQVWAEHLQTGRKQRLWRKQGADRELGYPWKETGIVTEGGSNSSSSSSSSFGSRASSTFTPSSSTTATAASTVAPIDFDPNSMIPPTLKRLAGKTWADVVTDPGSISYLRWVAENAPGHGKAAAAAALAWWNSGMPSKEQI